MPSACACGGRGEAWTSPPELRVIHEPVRLRILGLLYRQTDLGFATLRDALGLTAGNLASHANRLVEAGLVTQRDALTRDGFEKRYQITPQGLADFERYLHALDAFLAAARGGRGSVGVGATAGPSAVPVAAMASPLAAAASPGPSAQPRSAGRRSVAVLAAMGVGILFMAVETVQNILTDASGSSYVGIGVAGVLVAALGPLERLARRFAGGP